MTDTDNRRLARERLKIQARWLAEDGLLDGVTKVVQAAAQDSRWSDESRQRMRNALVVFTDHRRRQ